MQHLRTGSIVTISYMAGPSSTGTISGATVTNVTDAYLEVAGGVSISNPTAVAWSHVISVEVTQD